MHGRESVRELVADSPRTLVRAHVRRAAVAGALYVRAAERIVVLVAGRYGTGAELGFAGPGTRRLAAVPVAGGGAAAGDEGQGGGGEEEGEEGEEGGFGEGHFGGGGDGGG